MKNFSTSQRLEASLTDQLYRRSYTIISASLLNALVLAYIFKSSASFAALGSWIGAGIVVTVLRILIIFFYKKQPSIALDKIQFWKSLYAWGTTLAGIFWGSSVFLLFCGAPAAKIAFYVFLIAGTVSGSLAMYHSSLRIFYSFSIPVMVPLFVAFAVQKTQTSIAMAVVVGIYIIILIFIFKHINHATVQAFVLQFEKEDMAERLAKEKNEIQKLNQSLEAEISEKYRVQLELQKSKHDLQLLNGQLLSVNDKLEQMVRSNRAIAVKAESANAAKGVFLASMSHEIRTPLCGVLGVCELMGNTELDETQAEYNEMVANSARSLLAVINDILDFSRIEAGSVEVEQADFNLEKLLDDINAIIALDAQNKGIEYICAIKPDVPLELTGDPMHLRQVLINIIGNAIKFTDSGSVRIDVFVVKKTETKSSAVLCFEIRDTGIGISPDHVQNIFKAFSQANSTVVKEYGGTGLGLSISKRLVELMGGSIHLDSVLGRGTKITVSLDVGVRDFVATRKQKLEGIHFLLVSPSAELTVVMKLMLVAQGALIDCAENVDEALGKLKSSQHQHCPFDVVLVDTCGKEKDGIGVVKMLKHKSECNNISTILLTDISLKPAMVAQGCADVVLTKPVQRLKLINSVLELLGRTVKKETVEEKTRVEGYLPEMMGAQNITILVVEDNSINRQLLERIIAKIGCAVDSVTNGVKAIDALSSRNYDLVFMDMQMPEMDGVKTIETIRDINSSVLDHDIPVVAVTAHTLSSAREKCLKAGMNDFLAKPLDFSRIVEKIRRWGKH